MRLRLAIIATSLVVFGISYLAFRTASPLYSSGTFPTDPPTPYLHFEPQGSSLGTVLMIHGLNANKDLMRTSSMALADGGFEVYAADMPGHGSSQGAFSFSESVNVVQQIIRIVGSETIMVGHSMGGGVLAELATSNEFETMVLFSPAPNPLDEIHVGRLLVVSGGFDAPRINEFIPGLIDAAGARAFWWKYPSAGHSTALFDPPKLRAVVRWMGGRSEAIRVGDRFFGLALMTLAGLIIPFAIPIRKRDRERRTGHIVANPRSVVVEYVAAVFAAVVLLRFVDLLGWLRLFATDYMMSLVLVAGLLLWRGRGLSVSARGLAIASLGAAYVIGVFAVGIGSHLLHLIPDGTQWFRVPILTLVSLPLFLRDEETLRGFGSWWMKWGTFVVTRAILWAGVITGVLLLNNDAAFLILIMHLVVAFWLALWWMTGFVAARTGEPAAAALFAALVQGWVFAAIFVRI